MLKGLRKSFASQELPQQELATWNLAYGVAAVLRLASSALLHNRKRAAGGQGVDRHTSWSACVEADYSIFGRTKVAHAAPVVVGWRSGGNERKVGHAVREQPSCGEYVAALTAGTDDRSREHVVDEACGYRGRYAGRNAAQIAQRYSITASGERFIVSKL